MLNRIDEKWVAKQGPYGSTLVKVYFDSKTAYHYFAQTMDKFNKKVDDNLQLQDYQRPERIKRFGRTEGTFRIPSFLYFHAYMKVSTMWWLLETFDLITRIEEFDGKNY